LEADDRTLDDFRHPAQVELHHFTDLAQPQALRA
jgi:hypothetical protein